MARGDGTKRERLHAAPGALAAGLDAQKKSLRASERNEAARQLWRELMARVDAREVVFVDECGSHLALTPLYGYAPKGERAVGSAPKNRGQNTTILGALSWQGIQAAMTMEGAADGAAFEVFVEHLLVSYVGAGHACGVGQPQHAQKPKSARTG